MSKCEMFIILFTVRIIPKKIIFYDMEKRDVMRMAHADPKAVWEQAEPVPELKLPTINSPNPNIFRSGASATATSTSTSPSITIPKINSQVPKQKPSTSTSVNSTHLNATPANASPEVVVKTNKGWQPLSQERNMVMKDLMNFKAVSDTEAGPKMEPNENSKHQNWSKRQKIAWLLCYETEHEIRTTQEGDSRWIRFAKRMNEEFDVQKDNVQCQKQVFMNSLLHIS